jgi:Lysophospholipase L1 and related esterases
MLRHFSATAALAFAVILTPVSALAGEVVIPPSVGDETSGGLSPNSDPSITARPDVKKIAPKKIVLAGDSTTQVNSGWGGAFCAYHVSSFTACVNLARGGRSTYSYRAEGSWDNALSEMKAPGYRATYVLIQFGHNDQPGKPGRSTSLDREFPDNLRAYVKEARAAGAIPVLLTPLTRRNFENGRIRDDLAPWAEQVRAVAAEMKVPLIDLYARSRAAVQGLGAVEASRLAEIAPPADVAEAAKTGNSVPQANVAKTVPTPVPDPTGPQGTFNQGYDNTHLGRVGALYFSAMVADGLVRAVPELAKDILP